MADINRLKVVLVEKKKTNKWLDLELKKDSATILKWCTNTSKADLQTLTKIAFLLSVEVCDLTNKIYMRIPKQFNNITECVIDENRFISFVTKL